MGNHLGIDYKMRMPLELKLQILDSAKAHNRSMNADIVARLNQTFEQSTGVSDASTEELINELASRLSPHCRFIIEKSNETK